MKRSTKAFFALITALFIVGAVCSFLVFTLFGDQIINFGRDIVLSVRLSMNEEKLNTSIGADPTPLRFTIHQGDNARNIGQRLETLGFITDSGVFTDYVRYEDIDVQLEAGTYFLNTTMTIKEIAIALTDSRFSQIEFSILPGQRLEEIAANIDINPYFAFSGADFLAVVGRGGEHDPFFAAQMHIPSGVSLEGFLYPETYSLPPETTPIMLRDILTEAFSTNLTDDLRLSIVEQGYTIYEIVTIASIVEREAIHDDEKPLIASAYRNRLEDGGWRLDADPTVQYAKGSLNTDGIWWPRITVADYRSVISDYNTYINTGLPPGPISNPSTSSIIATVHPEETTYYFFRADCRADGYHDFSETYEEHQQRCQ